MNKERLAANLEEVTKESWIMTDSYISGILPKSKIEIAITEDKNISLKQNIDTASYDWYIDFANDLITICDEIELSEEDE